MASKNEFITAPGSRWQPGVQADRKRVIFTCISDEGVPSLVLYRKNEDQPTAVLPFPQPAMAGNRYSMSVSADHIFEYEYNYRVGEKEWTDPCAPGIAGRDVFGISGTGKKTVLRGRLSALRPYAWRDDSLPGLPPEQIIMYQLHVRGFTMNPASQVRHKGTFRGIAEKVPYLKELGINQIRLMPCCDFDEIVRPKTVGNDPRMSEAFRKNIALQKEASGQNKPTLNYWGYLPAFYFAPKASFASDPENASAEMKDMIRTCHKAGIEVILEFCFGNEVAMDLIIQCLTMWAADYHVDGFSVIARDSVCQELARLPLFSDRKLIASWFPDDVAALRANKEHRMLLESNDGFMNDCRRTLRGDDNCLNGFISRIRSNPEEKGTINFITHHDGFTLCDLVSYDYKHNLDNGQGGMDGSDFNYSWNCGEEGPSTQKKVRELRLRQMKNAYLLMLLAQGTPMLLAGDEFANSQEGNNNPYCHDSAVTWLDWEKRRKMRELTAFVRDAAAFRKNHGIFHRAQPLQCQDLHSCGYPDLSLHQDRAWYLETQPWSHHIGMLYAQEYANEKGLLYVAYNFHWEPNTFALPQPQQGQKWSVRIDTSAKQSFVGDDGQDQYEIDKTITVPGRTILVLETEEA